MDDLNVCSSFFTRNTERVKTYKNMSEEKKEQEKSPAQNPRTEEKEKGSEEKPKPATFEKPKVAEPEKPAKPAECVACNKSIKNLWYYREGKYFCSKGCWKKSKKSEKEAKDKEAKEKAAKEKAQELSPEKKTEDTK